jgi:hypothetical protein
MTPCFTRSAGRIALLLLFTWGSLFAQEGELPPLRRSFAEVTPPVPPFPEGTRGPVFEPRPGETIAWIGGTEIADLDRYGFLEAGMHLTWPGLGLRWRNLAWQGDTVYRQARPLYFYTKAGDPQPGSIPDHRERTEPGIVFIAFGKMESLQGTERLPDFVAAYAKLVDDLLPLTKRIVLVEPAPFFYSGPAGTNPGERDAVLSAYVEAIERLAAERNLLFISSDAEWNAGMSDNGVHLNESGHQVFAHAIRGQIRAGARPGEIVSPALRDAIARKNLLWKQYYRPTNWAFLFGDRQHVPASRDVEKREERWFVREIDSLPGLIAGAEADIQRYAKEATK